MKTMETMFETAAARDRGRYCMCWLLTSAAGEDRQRIGGSVAAISGTALMIAVTNVFELGPGQAW
jgi:hypothetical protein